MLRTILNYKPLLWLILSIPAVMMVYGYGNGRADAIDLLHPSGEFSARLMVLAMMIGPLISLFGNKGWLIWLAQRRRNLGVAAFGYALLHLIFYVIDMETVKDMLAEIGAPGIWTGWTAFVLMLAPTVISNDRAVRALKQNWKRIQQLAYFVAIFTLAHWLLLSEGRLSALINFSPLILVTILRLIVRQTRKASA